jgi:hypothetical protein
MKISNKIKVAALALAMMFGAVASAALPTYADVTCPNGKIVKGSNKTLADCDDLDKNGNNTNDLMGRINTIINVVIGFVGLVAVVVIILGGISYTTSAGDPGKVKKAKDTILYGIIGLVVAVLAFAIVNFVLGNMFA